MALYWMVRSVSVSGVQNGPESFGYSFTFLGPSTMSAVMCPRKDKYYGWENEVEKPADTVWSPPLYFRTTSPKSGFYKNVVYVNDAYFVGFYLNLLVEEGDAVTTDNVEFDFVKELVITEKISVNIKFRVNSSTVDSLTCTLRSNV